MQVESNSDVIFTGRGAGDYLLHQLEKANESVKIVSPYLTPSYVEKLLALSRKGVHVTLITSDKINEGDGSFSDLKHTDLIKQEKQVDTFAQKERSDGMFWSLVFLMVTIVATLLLDLGLFGYVLGGISFIVLLRYQSMKIYTYEYSSPFRLRVFFSQHSNEFKSGGIKSTHPETHLIHAKMYVIDEKIAFVGSINFTHDGLKRSYETCVTVQDQKAVKAISREIERLFNNKQNHYKSISEWGSELYTEPPN